VVATGLVGTGLFFMVQKSDEPAKMLGKILFSGLLIGGTCWFVHSRIGHLVEVTGLSAGNLVNAMLMLGAIVVSGLILCIVWARHISDFVISPLTGLFDGGNEPPEAKPFYSIALAKRNRGLHLEAVDEIRRQLEKFPNDFEGVMLLAKVQAEDLADLGAAEVTLNEFCDWPDAPLKQVAAAYTRLADWHLKLGADAEAARMALRKIILRFPDTETALQAEQRIAHLSDAEKMILAQRDRKNIELQKGLDNVGLLDSTEFLKPHEVEPGRLAAAHVKHLQAHPHDTEVREKLALIYGHDYKRLDLATMELAQLINEPKHQPKQIAHWLNLLANLQVELGADMATVRGTLEKIVQRFPNLPVADLAQRRLARLENEFKGLRQSSSVKLGTYEQNIGLKYGGPRKP
ncbi:MAG TPA: tetratricopeptide repeat protein, partial [Candidatus Acidoferrales bacterium]|nr:tetratricopeptide repeat protein [Candidatus Acidoferrales bacterium]